jgi:hypothetical protein
MIKNVRNKNYWGVDRSVSNSLSFVEDGAAILKYIFYVLGVEDTFLSIAAQRLNYDTVKGTINLSTIVAGVDNSITLTGNPGTTVYVKLTPTDDATVVYLVIKNSDGSYYYSGNVLPYLEPGQSKVFPFVIPSSGILKLIVSNPAIDVTAQMCTSDGNIETTYGFWYKQIFRSQLDLTTFAHTGSKVACTCLEDGLPKYLKANESTVFEFPMEVPDAIWVKMDGINMHDSLNYKDVDQLPISAGDYGRNFFGPCAFVSSDGDSTGVFSQTEKLEKESDTFATRMASLNVLITNAGINTITVNVSGTIEIKVTAVWPFGAGIKFGFISSKSDELNEYAQTVLSLPSLSVSDIGETFTATFNKNISLQAGESLFRGGQFAQASDNTTAFEFTENSKFKIGLVTRYAPTYVRAFRGQYLFEQLMNKVTEGNLKAAISSYFQTYKNNVFTSANAIRNIAGATMKIPFTDFYKFWDSFDSVGIQLVGSSILFDRKQNLIDRNNIIDLPEIVSQSLKVSLDKSFLFNEIHFGYPAISSDVGVLNANEETNDTMIFSLGTTSNPATVDKVSPIKAMPYEIEKIRITQLGQDTTSYPTDNDNYVLAIENELQPALGDDPDHYNLDRSLNVSATGILEAATIFNLPLSPKRMFLNNGAWIRSCQYRSDSKVFKFISSDKNNKLICGGVVENADVTIGDLDAPFFWPVRFDFKGSVPDDMEDLLDANPLQLFRFPFQGTMYVGIANTVSAAPSSRAVQSLQLLSVPENQLQNLIDYYG